MATMRRLVMAVLATTLVGCGPGSGAKQPVQDGSIGYEVPPGPPFHDGPYETPPNLPVQSFVGTWIVQASYHYVCGIPTELPAGSVLVWQAGTTTDLVQSGSEGWLGCPLPVTITGPALNLWNSFDCPATASRGALQITGYQFVIKDDGTATDQYAGYFDVPPDASSCGYQGNTVYTRGGGG
jgi:hypothetical protein